MAAVQFIQLAQSEMRQDAVQDFNMAADGNCIAMLGSNTELCTMELISNPTNFNKFPYNCANLKILNERPLTELTDDVNLQVVYENSKVQECQELALEPVYMAACSFEPIESRLLQANWAPKRLPDKQTILAVLTTYGALNIYSKHSLQPCWTQKLLSVHEPLINTIVPNYKLTPKQIKKFVDFKAYMDRYWITAFAWSTDESEFVIYVATAIGDVHQLKLTAEADGLVAHSSTSTDMGRICYLKIHKNILIAANISGVLKIYRINNESLVETACPWSIADRMAVQQAIVTYSETLECYFLLCSKAAHLLVFKLTREGELCDSTRLYVNGRKITGIQPVNELEFIASTMMGKIYHIKLSATTETDTLKIGTQIVQTDFDVENYQVLSVATSTHSNLWLFLLYRNKEYSHNSNYHRNTTLIYVGRLNITDSLEALIQTQIVQIEPYMDCLSAIRLEILNELNLDKYLSFLAMDSIELPDQITDAFVQNLQIKWIVNATMIDVFTDKLEKVALANSAKHYAEFLICALQMTHIIRRIQYLNGCGKKLTEFQQSAEYSMHKKFELLNNELQAYAAVEDHPLRKAILRFLKFINKQQHIKLEDSSNPDHAFECIYCYAPVTLTTEQCPCGYKPRFCTVSYQPLGSGLEYRYCSQCGSHALKDEKLLQQLFPADEPVRCTFCRFSFIYEDIENFKL